MPLHWHANLPGPFAYTRPIRRKGRKPGFLTSVLVWFIVKPLEWTFRGLAALFTIRCKPEDSGWYQSRPQVGWHQSPHGPLFFSGTNWYDRDGRPLF